MLIAGAGHAQDPPRFGASTELVVIDMIAADDDGRLVTDLRPDEIEVYEGGKRMQLEFLQLVLPGIGGAAPTSTSVRTPPSEGANQPVSLSLVVVVDVASMTADLLMRTREAIVAMARSELEPGTRLMLVSLDRGLQVRQTFTDQPEQFASAVRSLPSPTVDGETSLWTLIDEVEEACAALRGTPADQTPAGVQNAIGVARNWIESARLGMTTAYTGIGALARLLATLPGRKHVVLYSGGYAMDPSAVALNVLEELCGATSVGSRSLPVMAELQTSVRSAMQIDSAGMLNELLDEANRAQVSVYTVDARGLGSDALPSQSRAPRRLTRGGTAQQITQRVVRAPQEMLYAVADGTGGLASVNTNELARGLRAAARDARGYYLVAYAPPGGRKQGRYYTIELKLKRPGVRARYRRGYEWLTDEQRSERTFAAALRFPGLYADDGLALDPWVEGGKLNVAVILPTRSLSFREQAGIHRNELALRGLLRDERGRPVDNRYLFTKTIEMKLPEARYADLRSRDNVEIPADAPAPKPGRYQIAVVLRHSGGRLASATADLVVP
jgi:VWFA-related protein